MIYLQLIGFSDLWWFWLVFWFGPSVTKLFFCSFRFPLWKRLYLVTSRWDLTRGWWFALISKAKTWLQATFASLSYQWSFLVTYFCSILPPKEINVSVSSISSCLASFQAMIPSQLAASLLVSSHQPNLQVFAYFTGALQFWSPFFPLYLSQSILMKSKWIFPIKAFRYDPANCLSLLFDIRFAPLTL
jgi:hypothetical protein